MLSNKSLLALTKILDKLNHTEIDRIISVFNFPKPPFGEKPTVAKKATDIFNQLRYYPKEGPFSVNNQIDMLQYIIDDYFEKRPGIERGEKSYNPFGPIITFNNAFEISHTELTNNLKRDGYIIIGRTIRKLLPNEIEEAKIESDLIIAIDKFGFATAKGHLTQAISNHSQGNWAGANSQFRTFIESLLISINDSLLPSNHASSAAQAIKLLSETVNPPFLSKALNEYSDKKESASFVNGLWVRLHPTGSHPGLSDEDDSSFRYHISIVFANYLLRRLAVRKNVSF